MPFYSRQTWVDVPNPAALPAGAQPMSANRLAHIEDGIAAASLYFNVRDPAYGAKGDGVTDDHAAIQAALNEAAGASGTVIFPAGTYLIGGTLTALGGVRILGAGARCTTLKLAPGVNNPLLTTPDDGVQRYGLAIASIGFNGDAQHQTGTPHLIDIHGMNEPTIRDVYILNPRGAAIHFGQATAGIFCTVPIVDGVVIRGDGTYSMSHGLFFDSGSSDAIVHHCDIGSFGAGAGVSFSGHNGAVVSACNAWQCLYGYQLFQANRIRFDGCLSDYARNHGFIAQQSSDLQLTGCQARESSQTTPSTGDGFRFEGPATGQASNITLTNCRAMGTQTRTGVALVSNLGFVRVIGGSLVGNAVAPNVIGSGIVDYRFLAVAGLADSAG